MDEETQTCGRCPFGGDPRELWCSDYYADLKDRETKLPVFFIATYSKEHPFIGYKHPDKFLELSDIELFIHSNANKKYWHFNPVYSLNDVQYLSIIEEPYPQSKNYSKLGYIVYNDDPNNYNGLPPLNNREIAQITREWIEYECTKSIDDSD